MSHDEPLPVNRFIVVSGCEGGLVPCIHDLGYISAFLYAWQYARSIKYLPIKEISIPVDSIARYPQHGGFMSIGASTEPENTGTTPEKGVVASTAQENSPQKSQRSGFFVLGKEGADSKSSYSKNAEKKEATVAEEPTLKADMYAHQLDSIPTKAQQHYARAIEHVGTLRMVVARLLQDAEVLNNAEAKQKLSDFITNLSMLENSLVKKSKDSSQEDPDMAFEVAAEDDALIRDYTDIAMTAIDFYWHSAQMLEEEKEVYAAQFNVLVDSITKPLEVSNNQIALDHRPGGTQIFDAMLVHIPFERFGLDTKLAVENWYHKFRKEATNKIAAFYTTTNRFQSVFFKNSATTGETQSDKAVYISTPVNNTLSDENIKEYIGIYLKHIQGKGNTNLSWFEKSLPKTVQFLVLQEIGLAIHENGIALDNDHAQNALKIEGFLQNINGKAASKEEVETFQKIKHALSNRISNSVTNLRLLGASNVHERSSHTTFKDAVTERELILHEVSMGIISSEREHDSKSVTLEERKRISADALKQLIEEYIIAHGGVEALKVGDQYKLTVNFYSLIQDAGSEGKERAYKQAAIEALLGQSNKPSDFSKELQLLGHNVLINIKNLDRSVNARRHESRNVNDKTHFGDHRVAAASPGYKKIEEDALRLVIIRQEEAQGKRVLDLSVDDIQLLKRHFSLKSFWGILDKLESNPGEIKSSLQSLDLLLDDLYVKGAGGLKGIKDAIAENVEKETLSPDDISNIKTALLSFALKRAEIIIVSKKQAVGNIQDIYIKRKSRDGSAKNWQIRAVAAFAVKNKNNRIYDAALQNFYYDLVGDCTLGGCHSGKDRTSVILLYKDAIQNLYTRTGRVMDGRVPSEKKQLEEEAAFLIATGHYTKIAEMNCPGCQGMKSLLTYLPDSVIDLLKTPSNAVRKRVEADFINKRPGEAELQQIAEAFSNNIFESLLSQDYASRLNAPYTYRGAIQQMWKDFQHAVFTRSRVARVLGAVVLSVSAPAFFVAEGAKRTASAISEKFSNLKGADGIAFAMVAAAAVTGASTAALAETLSVKTKRVNDFSKWMDAEKNGFKKIYEVFKNPTNGMIVFSKEQQKSISDKMSTDLDFYTNFADLAESEYGKKYKKHFKRYLEYIRFENENPGVYESLRKDAIAHPDRRYSEDMIDKILKAYQKIDKKYQDMRNGATPVDAMICDALKKEAVKCYDNVLKRALGLGSGNRSGLRKKITAVGVWRKKIAFRKMIRAKIKKAGASAVGSENNIEAVMALPTAASPRVSIAASDNGENSDTFSVNSDASSVNSDSLMSENGDSTPPGPEAISTDFTASVEEAARFIAVTNVTSAPQPNVVVAPATAQISSEGLAAAAPPSGTGAGAENTQANATVRFTPPSYAPPAPPAAPRMLPSGALSARVSASASGSPSTPAPASIANVPAVQIVNSLTGQSAGVAAPLAKKSEEAAKESGVVANPDPLQASKAIALEKGPVRSGNQASEITNELNNLKSAIKSGKAESVQGRIAQVESLAQAEANKLLRPPVK